MVRTSSFLLNIVWTFLSYIFFLSVGSFCSRSECEKRKAIWDACVVEIKQDLGQTKDFDSQMLAVMDTLGLYAQAD
jgi:hypothetical protein